MLASSIILGLTSLAFKGIQTGVGRKRVRDEAVKESKDQAEDTRDQIQESGRQFDIQAQRSQDESLYSKGRLDKQIADQETANATAGEQFSKSVDSQRREELFGFDAARRDIQGREASLQSRRRDANL